MKSKTIKRKLMGLIKGMAKAAYLFAEDYKRDFTRKRKLSMPKL